MSKFTATKIGSVENTNSMAIIVKLFDREIKTVIWLKVNGYIQWLGDIDFPGIFKFDQPLLINKLNLSYNTVNVWSTHYHDYCIWLWSKDVTTDIGPW